MNKNQKGLGVIEGLLILIIVGLVGLIGYHIYHSNKTSSASSASMNENTPKSTLLTELMTSKTTAYKWDLKIYKDGSGTVDYTGTTSNTRPLPSNKSFPANTFDIASFQEQLNTLSPNTYGPNTSDPACNQSEEYLIKYNGNTFDNVQCYISITSNHATGLGSQISKIFNTAGL